MKAPRTLRLAAALLLFAAAGCWKPATYTRETLAESVKRMCKNDYGLNVESQLIGKTLYVSSVLDGLVGRDLGLQQETLSKLEGAMLSTTRVTLSTDADVNFLVVKARDSRLGVTVTLLRYLPDIKSLIYMRISRTDFEDRLVLETDSSLEPEPQEAWHDVPVTEFWARLVASRLQRQFSANPLVSAFLQVRRVRGTYKEGTLYLQLDKFENDAETNILIEEILQTAVEEGVGAIVDKYSANGIVKRVAVREESGRSLLQMEVRDILAKRKKSEKKDKPSL